MGVVTAKIAGFGLAYYAKQRGYCYKRLMTFKVLEMMTLIALEALAPVGLILMY